MKEAVKNSTIKVADESWIALALLTRENPGRTSFTAKEILDRLRRESAHPEVRPGVQAHIHLHNVANAAPNPARYRIFFRLEDGTYRLYRPGDPHHPERTGKTCPRRDDLPVNYHPLLDWYQSEYCKGSPPTEEEDPILRLRGLGKELWANIDADRFVEELRSGWSEAAPRGLVPETSGVSADVWKRLVRHQGDRFQTATGLPFTYEIEGASGIWFYRNGKRVNRRLSRSELESALKQGPPHSPTDLKEFQDPSYLFGILKDSRIVGREG